MPLEWAVAYIAEASRPSMATQLLATAELFEADTLTLVDLGGDVLTDGKDPGLRSPLADQLALAACLRLIRRIVAVEVVDGDGMVRLSVAFGGFCGLVVDFGMAANVTLPDGSPLCAGRLSCRTTSGS